jgi:hypothetical protein
MSRLKLAVIATLAFVVVPVAVVDKLTTIDFFSPLSLWINRIGYSVFFAIMLIVIVRRSRRVSIEHILSGIAILALPLSELYFVNLDALYIIGWFFTMFMAWYLDTRERRGVRAGDYPR